MARTTYSAYHLHESACDLNESGHEIRKSFLEVMKQVAEKAPVDCDHGAAGCGSCFNTDDPAAVFWVAQGDAVEKVAVKFDSDDEEFSRSDLGDLILQVAHENDVKASWTGDTSDCVILGTNVAYLNMEPGTRVARDRYKGEDLGTVMDPDVVNPEEDYEVREESDRFKHGDVLARAHDRESAEEIAETLGSEVHRTRKYASQDGDNLVLFDGADKPKVVPSEKLRVVKE